LTLRQRDLGVLVTAMTDVCLYGDYRRAVSGARILEEIAPGSMDRIDFDLLRDAVVMPYYFADRAGDAASVDALRGSVFFSSSLRPMPNALNGSALKCPYEMDPGDESTQVKKLMDEARWGMAADDLATLSTMAVFGGLDGWTRERIDAAFGATRARMLATPGFEPW